MQVTNLKKTRRKTNRMIAMRGASSLMMMRFLRAMMYHLYQTAQMMRKRGRRVKKRKREIKRRKKRRKERGKRNLMMRMTCNSLTKIAD